MRRNQTILVVEESPNQHYQNVLAKADDQDEIISYFKAAKSSCLWGTAQALEATLGRFDQRKTSDTANRLSVLGLKRRSVLENGVMGKLDREGRCWNDSGFLWHIQQQK